MTNFTREQLVEMASKDVLTVEFEKADGTLRKMKCTLKDGVAPKVEKSEKPRAVSQSTLPVWDIEKEAWRSFTIARVKNVEVYK